MFSGSEASGFGLTPRRCLGTSDLAFRRLYKKALFKGLKKRGLNTYRDFLFLSLIFLGGRGSIL